MKKEVLPDPRRKHGRWRFSFRFISAFTLFAFVLLQLGFIPAQAANNNLPDWLADEQDAWLNINQMDQLQKADAALITRLNALNAAQQQLTTQSADGVKALHLDGAVAVAKDAQGNALLLPEFNDQQQLQNGTLLLEDGTLQTITNGKVARQKDLFGNETIFLEDGRVNYEIAADGTRSDYSYQEGITRTTHSVTGDIVQQYDTQGNLTRVSYPDNRVLNYVSNYLASERTADGWTYSYTPAPQTDGTVVVDLTQAVSPAGLTCTLSNGQITAARLPDGTQLSNVTLTDSGTVFAANLLMPDGTRQTITAGSVNSVTLPDGRLLNYSNGFLSSIVQNGQPTALSYTTAAGGALATITAQDSTGTRKTYDSAGKLISITRADGTTEIFTGTNYSRWRYNDPFNVTVARDWTVSTKVAVAGGSLTLTGTGSNLNTNALYNKSIARTTAGEISFTVPFKVSISNSQSTLAVENGLAGTSYRRLELLHNGSQLVIRIWEGTRVTQKVVAVSSTTVNAWYNVKFSATTAGTSVTVWKEGAAVPAKPNFTWTWNTGTVRFHAWVKTGSLQLNSLSLETPAPARETLDLFARLRTPANNYAVTAPARKKEQSIYNADGTLKETTRTDGTRTRFDHGMPVEITDPDGKVTQITAEMSGTDLEGFSIARDGITRLYSTHGELSGLTLADKSELAFDGSSISGVTLADDTQVINGVYENNALVSGTVLYADGKKVRYAGKQIAEATLPDGTIIAYTNDKPVHLTLTSGENYRLRQNANSTWSAELEDSPALSQNDILITLNYSSDWQLLSADRVDNAHLVYSNGKLSTLTQADGLVISYAYDSAGRLLSTVAVSPDASQPSIRSEYAYDKIRKVYQVPGTNEVLVYSYSYEFTGSGDEITAIREETTGLIKRYLAGQLISQTDADGAVTAYEYTDNASGWNDPLADISLAYQTLPDGAKAVYQKIGANPVRQWKLTKFILSDGTEISDPNQSGYQSRADQAAIPTDRRSILRLERTGVLKRVPGLNLAPNTELSSSNFSIEDPPASRIARSTLTYQGQQRGEFTFQYEGDLTKITDDGGTTRVYNAANELLSVQTPDGQTWNYLTVTDIDGSTVRVADLTAVDHPDGARAEYSGSSLTRVYLPDGTSFKNLVWNDDGRLVSAVQVSIDGIETALPNPNGSAAQSWTIGADKTGSFVTVGHDGGDIVKHAQSFVLPGYGQRQTNSINLFVRADTLGSPAGGLRVKLFADSQESPSGDALAESVITNPTLGAWNQFQFGSNIQLTAGQRYWITVEYLGPTELSTAYRLGASFENSYADGSELNRYVSSQRWLAGSRALDLAFQLTASGQALSLEGIETQLAPYRMNGDTLTEQEFDGSGILLTQSRSDGQVTFFNARGQIETITDAEGRLQTEYIYTGAGDLAEVRMPGVLTQIAEEAALARADLESRSAQALQLLAEQRGVAAGQINQQIGSARAQLAVQESELIGQLNALDNTKASGKAGRRQKNNGMDQLRGGIQQVQSAQQTLDQQYAQMLGELDSQINQIRLQIDTETEKAFTQIQQSQTDAAKAMLKQIITPVVYTEFRRGLGRDPDAAEWSRIVDPIYDQMKDQPAAHLDLPAIRALIEQSADRQARVEEVLQIRAQVRDWFTNYLPSGIDPNSLSLRANEAISSLDLTPDDIVALSADEVEQILTYLDNSSLHFGQSAYLALKELLSHYTTEIPAHQLATEAIVIDILGGVITPKTEGDLELSLYALGKVGTLHNLPLIASKISFEELRGMTTLPGVKSTIAFANPNGMAYNAAGNTAYVTHFGNGTYRALSEVDLATNAILRTVVLPGQPEAYTGPIAASADGQWLAVGTVSYAGKPDQTVFLINAHTFEVAASFNGFGAVATVAFSPDNSTLYAADSFTRALTRVNLATQTKIGSLPLPNDFANPMLVFSPNGQTLYVGSESTGRLAVVNLANPSAPIQFISTGVAPRAMALHANGTDLYLVSHNTGMLTRFNTTTWQKTGEVYVGWGPQRVSFSSDGSKALVTTYYNGELAVVDIASFTRTQIVTVGGGATEILVDHNGREILVTGGGGVSVVVLDAPGPAIAHVNGNHYILILSIAPDGTITYREPNQGPNGTTLTMSEAQFRNIWDGAILSARAPPKPSSVLSVQEAKSITGSFFPLLFLAFAAIASSIGTAIGAVIATIAGVLSAVAGVIGAVFSAIGGFISGLGTFFSGFGSFFSGFGFLGQGLGAIFSGHILAGLSTIGGALMSTIIPGGLLQLGISVGVSKGLEALGVSPMISSLAGAFVSGGIGGMLNPAQGISMFTSAVSGALTSTAIAGTQIGLTSIGLDPALASIASIGVGAITSSFTAGVAQINSAGNVVNDAVGNPIILHGTQALSQTFRTSLAPTLAGELGFYGIQKLGESIGLDPRISQLAGMPIKSAITNTFSAGSTSQSITHAFGQGLINGAVSIGLQTGIDAVGLDPLAGALASRAITGALAGAINPNRNIFEGIGRAYQESVGNFSLFPTPPDPKDPRFTTTLTNGQRVWNQQAYNQAIGQYEASRPVWMAQSIAKTNDFAQEIRTNGFSTALENYATSIFHRDSVESLVQSFGSIKAAIEEKLRPENIHNVTLSDGTIAKELLLSEEDMRIALLLAGDPTAGYSLLGVTEDDLEQRYTDYRVNRQTHEAGMVSGTIRRTYRSTAPDGTTVTAQFLEEISAGGVTKVTVYGQDGQLYTITPNNFQDVRLNADGTIRDGLVTTISGDTLKFKNNLLAESHSRQKIDFPINSTDQLIPETGLLTSDLQDLWIEIKTATGQLSTISLVEDNPSSNSWSKVLLKDLPGAEQYSNVSMALRNSTLRQRIEDRFEQLTNLLGGVGWYTEEQLQTRKENYLRILSELAQQGSLDGLIIAFSDLSDIGLAVKAGEFITDQNDIDTVIDLLGKSPVGAVTQGVIDRISTGKPFEMYQHIGLIKELELSDGTRRLYVLEINPDGLGIPRLTPLEQKLYPSPLANSYQNIVILQANESEKAAKAARSLVNTYFIKHDLDSAQAGEVIWSIPTAPKYDWLQIAGLPRIPGANRETCASFIFHGFELAGLVPHNFPTDLLSRVSPQEIVDSGNNWGKDIANSDGSW